MYNMEKYEVGVETDPKVLNTDIEPLESPTTTL